MADQTEDRDINAFNLLTPADGAAAVTPHNTNPLAVNARSLYVGGAGDVTVVMVNDDEVTFESVPAGTVLPVRVKKVKATGTTATKIVAMY